MDVCPELADEALVPQAQADDKDDERTTREDAYAALASDLLQPTASAMPSLASAVLPAWPLHLVQLTSCFCGGRWTNPCIYMSP